MPAVTQPTTTDDKEQGRTTSTHTDTKAEQQPTTTDGKHNIKAITHQTDNDTILLYDFISGLFAL